MHSQEDTLGAQSREPSRRAQCYLAALRAAGDPQTDCMEECIRTRAGVRIGGGCWHVCYAYRFPLPRSSLFKRCPESPTSGARPASIVACSDSSGSSVRGVVIDESTRRPVVGARAILRKRRDSRSLETPFAQTSSDSSGAFAFTVPPGAYTFDIRALDYLRPEPTVVRTAPARSCRISVELRGYANEGF